MKIALIGYGGMGKAVEKIAQERGHDTVALDAGFDPSEIETADVVIDFSSGDAAIENTKLCIEKEKNLVLGSTGWYDKLPEVRKMVEDSEIGFLWSSNFSIGVNLYFKIIDEASKLIDKFDEYDIWGQEIHHSNKADSPSGTAKTLEEILLKNIARKISVVEEKLDRKRKDDEIHFSSVRGGPVNFAHTIGFDSAADTITISHAARNRDGYALGAVKAAEWLKDKKGYFEMNDFLNF